MNAEELIRIVELEIELAKIDAFRLFEDVLEGTLFEDVLEDIAA